MRHSVCGVSLVAPQGKWTWTDGAGSQCGVAVIAVFTALTVVSSCVLLAALLRINQYLIEKFTLSNFFLECFLPFLVLLEHSAQDFDSFTLLHMHICTSLCSQSSVCCSSYLCPDLIQEDADCNSLNQTYTEMTETQL